MNTLIQHVYKRTAEAQEWVDTDPTNRTASVAITDPKHWASYSITTPAEYDQYQNNFAKGKKQWLTGS